MKVLVDHNIEGQSVLLWDVLAAEGWLELVLARLDERGYRERCSMRLLEIMLDIDQYRGTQRVFIP